MADNIGIKVSSPSSDVHTAMDTQLLYVSSWPTMKIAFSGKATVDAGTSSTIVTHNLGYAPMFLIYRVNGTTSEFNSYGSVFDGSGVAYIGSNSTELKYFASGFGSGSVSFYYYVIAQPLTEAFTASTLKPGAGAIYDNSYDYGIKVAKAGKDINSTDLRDYVIHSNSYSPGIHMVRNGLATDPAQVAPSPAKQFKVTHGLGYEPMALCYVDYGANGYAPFVAGYYYMVGGVGGPAYIRFYTDSTTCRLEEDYTLIGKSSATSTTSIVIFKESFQFTGGYFLGDHYG